MRVAYDATPLVAGDTGVARYTRSLADALEQRGDVELERFAIGRAVAGGDGSGRRIRIPLRAVHASWELLRRPTIERLLRTDGIDVVHSLDMVPPPSRHPVVVTVHDFLPLDRPHSYAPRNIRIAAAQARAIRHAAMVVTTCEATAADVVAHTAIDRDRIVVAPPAPRPPSPAPPPSPVPPPFLLAVGAVTPRKGVGVLAEALARVPDAPPLVVAGPDGWHADDVRRQVAAAGMDDRVRWLGRVDDRQLEGLYRHATLLCHVSEAEGFGIP
jgi:glycosyltransferase involved in cell wall biosynthesis